MMVKVIATCFSIPRVELHNGLQYFDSTPNKMKKLIPHLCIMTCWLVGRYRKNVLLSAVEPLFTHTRTL